MEPAPPVSTERNREFMRLLTPVQHRLMHFARAMTRDVHEADDLVADTVLAALERFAEVRDQRAFLSFLFTIASRLHRRKRLRSMFFGDYCEERALRIHDPGVSPESSAEVQLLYRALAQLPERQREAVMLFEISDLTLEEIRAIQGGSLSGVKMRVVRGREALSRILGVPANGGGGIADRGRPSTPELDREFDNMSLLTITGATRNA
ncbi:MAG TPA: RNA polymerase sigma factor [Candidatus Kapabacteria bacterium]|jgi:RNA polymerase sigma-70 factor (ECF subfamily)|nr:RNA polymerase sigma factor [Candidatus Kapabacteria bacterium]